MKRIALALLFALTPLAAFAQVPPPVPALPDTERRTSYAISGTTCACAVGFAIYGDGADYQNWIDVWLNGVNVSNTDPTFGWTLTSPSGSFASMVRPITDAVLTFNSAQTGTVQIVGARRPRRVTQFSENRGVAARDLNQAFTDVVAQNREEWDKLTGLFGGTTWPPARSGTTNIFATINGTLTSGHALVSDGNGNLIDSGGSFVSSASGVTAAGANQLAFYNSAGSVVSGLGNCGNGYYVTNASAVPSCTSTVPPLNVTNATPIIGMVENDSTPTTFNWVLSGGILGLRHNLSFPAIFTIDSTNNDRVTITHPTAVNDTYSVVINRNANFSGGTTAGINNALAVLTTVAATDGNTEWGLFSQIIDNAAGGNLAFYAQNQRHGTGIDWAAVFEVDDFTAGGNPTNGVASVEADLWAQGGDSHNARTVLDVTISNTNVGGTAPTVSYGVKIGASNGIVANGTYTYGLAFAPATFTNLIGFDTHINTPAATNGIDFTPVTFSGNAFATKGFQINAGGDTQVRHIRGGTGVPTANTCVGFTLGTNATDTSGSLTYTSATTCSINFGVPFASAPFCVVSPGSAASTTEVTTTTTVMSVTFGSAQTVFAWHCMG